MKIYERAWNMIKNNPLAAFAAFEGLSFLGGAVFPDESKAVTDRLRFKDKQVTTAGGAKNLGAYGQPSQRITKTVPRTGVFGKTSGFLYDVQKGIGSFLAAPIDMGRRFSPWAKSGNVGWDYLTGKNGATWKDVQTAIRTDLGMEADEVDKVLSKIGGSFLDGAGSPGPGGGGKGRQQIKIAHKNFPGYGSQVERIRQARQTQGYGPNQLRAIALALNDANLRTINRETGNVKTNKLTITLPSRLRGLV